MPSAPRRMASGVSFPADARGVRSTTGPAKSVWAAAALGLGTEEGAALAAELLGEKDWRHGYAKHAVRLAELQSVAPPARCVASCEAGLAAAAETLQWRQKDGKCVSLRDAMSAPARAFFRTAIVRGGSGEHESAPRSEHGSREREKKRLVGDAALGRARGWAEDGCVEPDVVDALTSVAEEVNDDWTGDDLHDTLFALLGGTSELCPLKPLLRLGASVALVARAGDKLDDAVAVAASSEKGTMYVPFVDDDHDASNGVSSPVTADEKQETGETKCADAVAYASTPNTRRSGADLCEQTPEIAEWLRTVFETGTFNRIVVGAYAYADGEAHVRATLACDLILTSLQETLGNERVCSAFLSSPGTAFPIPKAAWRHAKGRERDAEQNEGVFHWRRLVGLVCGGGFVPNCRAPVTRRTNENATEEHRTEEHRAETRTVYVHDGHVILQGPNYALSKTMQNWRAVVCGARGVATSANMAPGSRTRSMQHVRAVSIALEGQKHFPPLRPFDADETRDTMAVLLLRDLGADRDFRTGRRREETTSDDDDKDQDQALKKNAAHPMDVFGRHAVHGGTWRCPWSVDSIGRASVVAGTLWG